MWLFICLYIYDSNSMQVICVGLCLKSCQHHELSTCFSHTPTHIWQSHYPDQKHELTFQATLLRSYKVKESHRNVVLRDSCDFVAFMALLGYNKTLRLRPCELVQTAETGCSWRLQVPFRIFLILFSGCFIQSVMAARCCDGLKTSLTCGSTACVLQILSPLRKHVWPLAAS